MKKHNILWVVLALLISFIVYREKLKKDSVGQELFTGEVGEYVGMWLPKDTIIVTPVKFNKDAYMDSIVVRNVEGKIKFYGDDGCGGVTEVIYLDSNGNLIWDGDGQIPRPRTGYFERMVIDSSGGYDDTCSIKIGGDTSLFYLKHSIPPLRIKTNNIERWHLDSNGVLNFKK